MIVIRFLIVCVACCLTAFLAIPLVAQESADVKEATPAEDLRQSLLGAWALAGDADSTTDPQPGARMKFWGLEHWVVTETNPDTGELLFHHGGTYTLEGNNYAETIKFAGESTKDIVGMTFKFKIKVEGDKYTQNGVGNQFNERWVRLKNKE